jgi:hypothetical protein
VFTSDLPWIWVGYYDGFSSYGCTDIVNEHVQYGDVVNVNFLENLVGIHQVKWIYLNLKLEEKVIDSVGLVIENGRKNH